MHGGQRRGGRRHGVTAVGVAVIGVTMVGSAEGHAVTVGSTVGGVAIVGVLTDDSTAAAEAETLAVGLVGAIGAAEFL